MHPHGLTWCHALGMVMCVVLGDLNGDDVLDLATGKYDNTVSVFLGVGDGTFTAGSIYAVGRDPESMALGDLNGDGALDVATANHDSDDVSALLNRTPAPRTVYRFWSPAYSRHFYTIRPAERDKLINSFSSVWTYEDTMWYAYGG